jgi:hypothetical protein
LILAVLLTIRKEVGERVVGAVEAESTFENYSSMVAKLLCFMLGSVRDRVWLEKYWLTEEQSAAGDEVWTLRYDSAREPSLVGVILGQSRSRGVRGLHSELPMLTLVFVVRGRYIHQVRTGGGLRCLAAIPRTWTPRFCSIF